jgi:hypothetical protein
MDVLTLGSFRGSGRRKGAVALPRVWSNGRMESRAERMLMSVDVDMIDVNVNACC